MTVILCVLLRHRWKVWPFSTQHNTSHQCYKKNAFITVVNGSEMILMETIIIYFPTASGRLVKV
jgi:hypothetical protein